MQKTGWMTVAVRTWCVSVVMISGCIPAKKTAVTVPVVSAPVFSPGGGTYETTQMVSITDTSADSSIYYSTNDSTPTAASTRYVGPITISNTTTLRAIAIASGNLASVVTVANYRFILPAATPQFSPVGGAYAPGQTVSISDSTPTATIYYTTNGTAPSSKSTAYTGPIAIGDATLKAVAVATGFTQSAVASANYTVTEAATEPVFSPPGGTYTTAQQVSINDGTPGALIYYTTNGTTPSTSSAQYAGPLTVSSSETLKAIAVSSGFPASAVAASGYVIGNSPTNSIVFVHPFGGSGAGGKEDAASPQAALIQANDGNFYGTTFTGGAYGANTGSTGLGCGTVFRVTPTGVETVLYSFTGECVSASTDAAGPTSTLLQASDGNFYGTAGGGAYSKGTVFKITPTGVETVLYSFGGTDLDGSMPTSAVIQGTDGNLYGTTELGGTNGEGSVFQLTLGGVERTIYSFAYGVAGSTDADKPTAALVQGSDGNLYGTSQFGGSNNEGTVYQVTTAGVETILQSCDYGINGSTDAKEPTAALTLGADGIFYGSAGGGPAGTGAFFKITPAGLETVIGAVPVSTPGAALTLAGDGNFYGTSQSGGIFSGTGSENCVNGCGTVFRLTPAGAEMLLFSFNFADGQQPNGLVIGVDGNLYGTARSGGGFQSKNACTVSCSGTVFSLTNVIPGN